jgi:two-component system, NtrC family, sensor kinase
MILPRWLVNILAALVLVGILAYLYLRTEAVDFRHHNQVIGSLLSLKDLDSGWNLMTLETSLEPSRPVGSLAASIRGAGEALDELQAATADVTDPDLVLALQALRSDVEAKMRLLERWQMVRSGIDRPDGVPRVAREAEIARQIQVLPTGPRIDTLMLLFNKRFQRLLDEKEVYRVYLISFSAALLVVVAWIGSRLLRSFRLLSEANRALTEANEGLERRVAERTRELSEALRHLKESETLLIQSEKMSSLGQMVAGIAHEINTPLAYVKSSLQLVQVEIPHVRDLAEESDRLLAMLGAGETDEQRLSDQFSRAAQAAGRFREHQSLEELDGLVGEGLHGIREIAELVLNLKNFSRLDRSKVAQFDLNEGLESTLVIARNLLKHKTLNKRFGDIPPITCWPSQVNQVFLNLLTNAAQATPEEGGVITVATRREDPRHVAVEVEDNGHGIAEEVLPRIFDPFFTTKEVGRGTGLGLSIAYKIVEQHGGSIRVSSRTGVGTRFTVILPIEPPPAAGGV